MFIRIFHLLIFFVVCVTSNAQDVAVSEEIFLKSDRAFYLVGQLEDRFILFRDLDHKFMLHGYDESMLSIMEKEIEFDFNQIDIVDVIDDKNDHFNILFSARKKGFHYLIGEKYNAKGQKVKADTLIKEKGFIDHPTFEIVMSEDFSKILLYEIKDKDKIQLHVIDSRALDMLWEKEVVKNNLNFYINLKEILCSNEGEVFIANLEKDGLSKRSRHYFVINSYRNSKKNIDNYNIYITPRKNYHVDFAIDNLNKKISVAGLYSDKNLIRANGYYYINIPINNPKKHELVFKSFDPNFIKEYLEKRSVKKKYGLLDAKISELVLRRDGGILVIGEKVKTKDRFVNNRSEHSFKQADFFYEELFLLSINPDGSDQWNNIIHKRQYSFDDEAIYSSYYLLKTNNSLNIIFNDEIKTGNTVSEFKLNSKGEYKRRAILNTKNLEIKLRIRDAVQTASNQIVIPSHYKSKLKLVKFSF